VHRTRPVLFLRSRTLGFAAAIEGILADLRTREDLPWSLLNIVGEESSVSRGGNRASSRERFRPRGQRSVAEQTC